jgi:hypothetical protein
MATLMGPKDAEALYSKLDESLTALELRAAIATNSKTAQRQAIAGTVNEAPAPGAIGTLLQGEPINATKRVIQFFTGQTPEMTAMRQTAIMDEIAGVLTSVRGQNAKDALVIVQNAIAGQPVTDAQARLIARALGSALAAGGYQTGTRLQSTP